jgi:hypothetical protein
MLRYDRANTIMWRTWLRIVVSLPAGETEGTTLGESRSLRVIAKVRFAIAHVNYPKLVQLRSAAVTGESGFFRNFVPPRSAVFRRFQAL